MIGAANMYEMSVYFYDSARRNIPEGHCVQDLGWLLTILVFRPVDGGSKHHWNFS
jgi:hypothetical protein